MPSKRRTRKPPPRLPPPSAPPQQAAEDSPAPDFWASCSTSSSSWSTQETNSSVPSCSSSCAEGEESRDLAFLHEAFSTVPADCVEAAYHEAACDVLRTCEILASVPYGKPTPPFPHPTLLPKRRQFIGKVACGMVMDVIGKEYWGRGGKEGNCTRGKPCAGLRVGARMALREIHVMDAEQFLCAMLGKDDELGMGVVKDVLGQCEGNVEKALDALLVLANSSTNDSHPISCECEIDGINIDTSYHGSIKGLLKSTDMRSTMMHHLSEKETQRQYNSSACSMEVSPDPIGVTSIPSNFGLSKSEMPQKVLDSLFNLPDNKVHEHHPSSMNWKKVVAYQPFGQTSEFSTLRIYDDNINKNIGKGDGCTEFRDVATKYYDMKKTCYNEAKSAFFRGQRSYASVLAEKGREYGAIAVQAEERASQEIFEARNKSITNTITIDLHGQHVKQAVKILKFYLMFSVDLPSMLLRIITGCGYGTGTGKGTIKQAVLGLVKREGIEWTEENAGAIVLHLYGRRKYSFVEERSDDVD